MVGPQARAADYARLVAVPAIWGGAFAAGKIVVAVFSPLMGSFARYAIACVALLVAAFALEGGLPRLSRRQVLATVLLGVFGVFLYNLLFLGSLQRLPASRAALIIALNPAITIAISSLVLHERLRARRWLGVAIALLGVWIVLSHGELASIALAGIGRGEVLMFGAVTCWALYTILGRKVLGGLTPLAATSYAALWGTLMLGAVVTRLNRGPVPAASSCDTPPAPAPPPSATAKTGTPDFLSFAACGDERKPPSKPAGRK